MNDRDVVILSAVRTAQGRFQGAFVDTPAQELGAVVIKAAVERAAVPVDQIDEVIMGNVIQAGLGQNPARQAMLKAGLPSSIPAFTVNRVCVSGATAIAFASSAIKAGDGEMYVVGGMENMSRAPWLLQNGRSGYRMGLPSDKIFDSMVLDGLWCAVDDQHMGFTAENLSERYGISRAQQDEVALNSHLRAVAAIDGGRFHDEIVPVVIPQRKGDPLVVDTDECPRRDASIESTAKLKPFFKPDGVVTAGNSSAISDGASALVICSRAKARELGLEPLATVVSYAAVGVDADVMGLGETLAGQKALAKAGLNGTDVKLAELNEAFACVAALATREIGLDATIVNVNGGAVALGHPLGSTGSRMVVTLVHELRRRGADIGLASACVGGGQGAGTVIKVEG